MAIKIKNKSKKPSEDETKQLDDLENELESEMDPEPDAFQHAAVESVSWAAKHTSTVIVAILVVVALAASSYFLLHYLESRKTELSSELNTVFDANSWLIQGSPEFKALEEAKPDFDIPTFDSETQREETILKAAEVVTKDASGDNIEVAALLAEASAQLKLGQAEKAQANYEKIPSKTLDKNVITISQFGLTEALLAQKKYDDALKSLEKLEKEDEKVAKNLRFTKAKILESMGKKEEAKKLYHAILDDNSAGLSKSDIERRLANL